MQARLLMSALSLCALWAAGAAAADPAAPAAPAAPALPALPAQPARPDLDAELASAQRQLEEAAHEVARLSTQLSGSLIEQVMPFVSQRVFLGVQLEPIAGAPGARVHSVSPGGPADEAGVRPGDILLMLNGTQLRGEAPARQVSHILRDVKPDTPLSARLVRAGHTLDLTITARGGPAALAALPEVREFGFQMPELPRLLGDRPLRDMELASLTPRLGSYFGTERGVLVVRAPADGALGLEDGDVILTIDGRQPLSGSHAARILGSYQPGEKIALRVLRQHKTLDLDGVLPERARDAHHREVRGPRQPAAPVWVSDASA